MGEIIDKRLAPVGLVLLALCAGALFFGIPAASAESLEGGEEETCMIEPWECGEEGPEQPEPPEECMIERWECGEEEPAPCDRAGYIVVLHDWVEDPGVIAREHVEKYDGSLGFVYRYALKGYSAEFPTAAIPQLEQEPTVNYVEEDGPVEAAAASSAGQTDGCAVGQPEPPEEETCMIPEGCPEVQAPLSLQIASVADEPKCGKGKVRRGDRCVPRRSALRRACSKRPHPQRCLRLRLRAG